MPVRHRDRVGEDLADYGPSEPKRCKHCDESRSSCGGSGAEGAEGEGCRAGEASWRVTLDRDLVETLSAIYPEWFKPQHHRRVAHASSSDCDEPRTPATPATPATPNTPHTPPSDDTLSSGGEMAATSGASEASCSSGDARAPRSPRTPPRLSPPTPPRLSPPKAVVDASPLQQSMDRNKESLKVKLMMRRPLNALVAQGIMPPLKTPPAYFEQRRQLERAKTGDLLKAKIQKRPDRQELERRHILELQEGHVDPSLAEKQRMLKKARLADQLNDQLSHRPGPLELIKKNILHTEEPIEDAVKRGLLSFRATSEGAMLRPQHPSSYCGPSEEYSPSPSPPSTLSPASVASPPLLHPAPGKDKNRKSKSKLKQAPKARPIKFHEYKGPPNAQKASTPPSGITCSSETSYDLLLQQQQLFLQLMLSAAPGLSPVASPAASDSSDAHSYSTPPAPPPPPPLPVTIVAHMPATPARIEEMKVSELRAECKRHNLRVSGPKPQLIDRLRPYLGEDSSPRSPVSIASPDPRPESVDRETSLPPQCTNAEDIVQSQRRQIEDLERKLEASRQQLEAVRREAAAGVGMATAGDQQQGRRLLQAKIYESRLRAQLKALQQPPAPQPAQHQAQAPPSLRPPPPRYILAAPEPSPERGLVQLIAMPPTSTVDGSEVDIGITKSQSPAYILNGVKVVPIAILPSHFKPQEIQAQPPPPPPPPPLTSELTHSIPDDMDDVLEVLAENGELPSSTSDTDFLVSDPFSPGQVLSPDDILGNDCTPDTLVGDDLQRELNDIQNEILQGVGAGCQGGTNDCASTVTDDLTVDLLSNDGFATDFGGRHGDSGDPNDLFGSYLRGETDQPPDLLDGHGHMPMDINDCLRDSIADVHSTECMNGDISDHSQSDVFGNITDLSFPSMRDEDMSNHGVFGHERNDELDLKDFDLCCMESEMSIDPSDSCDYMEMETIPNHFGRGHQLLCDPLLGGVLSRPPARTAHKLYSYKIEYDGT